MLPAKPKVKLKTKADNIWSSVVAALGSLPIRRRGSSYRGGGCSWRHSCSTEAFVCGEKVQQENGISQRKDHPRNHIDRLGHANRVGRIFAVARLQ